MPELVKYTFPECYTSIDKATVYALLHEAERYSFRYDGNWCANWLLSDIHDIIWIINIEGVTRKTKDGYLRAERFYWNIMLCDGSNLSDLENRQFLNLLQNIGFLAREYGDNNSWKSHKSFCDFLVALARWLYLHRDIYDPTKKMLTCINMHSIKDYFYDFSKGGVAWLLNFPQLILLKLYEHALKNKPPASVLFDPFSVPENDRILIKEWLLRNKLITNKGRHWVTNLLKFIGDSEKLGIDIETLRYQLKFRAFLSQFEHDIVPKIIFDKALREYPSHRSPTYQEVVSSQIKFESMALLANNWRQLFVLKRHFPEELPNESEITVKSFWQFARDYSTASKHTPWIPLNVALTYTNESLRWVHEYGNDIVSLYLDVVKYLQETVRPNPADQVDYINWRNSVEAYANSLSIPSSLKSLNIFGFFSQDENVQASYNRFRSNPTICETLDILIGAIAILIGFLKPMRESELRNLSLDCTELISGDGYWLSQPVRKKRVGDTGDNGSRPIPYIVAKAIEILRRLSHEIKSIERISDTFLLDKLFVIKPPKVPTQKAGVISARTLVSSLDAFCDYVNLPPDEYGRRWYLRFHETRKSFLIVFFWCFRYSSLEAARWMAMHGNVSHLYAYIQDNFPGMELPELEAQYATRQLWDFEVMQRSGETDNVEDLYIAVCKHFNVTKLNLLNEKDIEDWLEIAFRRGLYEIQPYSVNGVAGIEGTRIAFRIKKVGGDVK